MLHIPDKHCICDANVKHSNSKINKIFTPNLFTLPNSTAVISKQNYKPLTTAILNIFKQCFEQRSKFTILGRISPLSTERRWPEANTASQVGADFAHNDPKLEPFRLDHLQTLQSE